MSRRAATVLPICATIAAVALLAPGLKAQHEPPPTPAGAPTPGTPSPPAPVLALNAAAAYRKAWDARPALFDNKFLQKELMGDANWAPTPEVGAQLEAGQPEIAAILGAVKIEPCDWGIAYEKGFDALVPHVAKFGVTARVLFADARRLLAKGDTGAAVQRISAIIMLPRHLRHDGLVLSTSTGQQVGALGMGEAERLATAGKLDGASRTVLLDALRTLDSPDPVGMKDALTMEARMIRDWTKAVCKGPNAGKVFLERIAPRATPEERAASGIESLNEEQVARQADRVEVLYQQVLGAWDLRDAVQQIKALETQKKAGDFGSVAVLTGSDLQHSRVVVGRFTNGVAHAIQALGGQPGGSLRGAPGGAAPAAPAPAPNPGKGK